MRGWAATQLAALTTLFLASSLKWPLCGGSVGSQRPSSDVRMVLVHRLAVVGLFALSSPAALADALLARLDRDQPIAGAEVIALERCTSIIGISPGGPIHFRKRSSPRASGCTRTSWVRRASTRRRLVVDGRDELTGSNASGAASAIAHAAHAPHVAVKLARQGDAIAIDIAPAPASEGVTHAMLATTERNLRTAVTGGENRGETLAHGPIVRTLRFVADLGPQGLRTTVQQPAHAGTRVVVFVEARDSLHVLGAGTVD